MYPRQSSTPRCSAKPTRHPAHPDVDPHAVSKRQLALRLSMKIASEFSGNNESDDDNDYKKDDDANDFDTKSCNHDNNKRTRLDDVEDDNDDNGFQSELENQCYQTCH